MEKIGVNDFASLEINEYKYQGKVTNNGIKSANDDKQMNNK